MSIIKNDRGEYSLVYGDREVVAFGIYDAIEEMESGSDWIYKVRINNVIIVGINFGVKYGIISGYDGRLLVPIRYDEIKLRKNYFGNWSYLDLINGSLINEFSVNDIKYYESHKLMEEKDIEQVKKFFSHKEDKFIVDIVNQFGYVRRLDALVPFIFSQIAKIDLFKSLVKNLIDKGYHTIEEYLIVGKKSESFDDVEGILDRDGNLLAPCKYNSINKMSLSLVEFVQNDKKRQLSFFHYSKIQERFDGLCELEFVGETNKHKIFRTTKGLSVYYSGSCIASFENVEEIRFIFGPLFSIKKNGHWGVMDIKNNVIIPCIYDFSIEIINGLAVVKKDGFFGLIDEHNTTLIDCQYECMYLEENLIRCKDKNGLWGIIDTNNSVIVPFEYKCLFEISEGVVGALNKDNKIGFLSINNQISIPFQYWWPEKDSDGGCYNPVFKYGLASVNKEKKFGFINHKGEEVIPFKFDYVQPFENCKSFCQIVEHNGYGYIEYSYFVYLNGIETLIDEEFHEVESHDDPMFYEGYPRSSNFDDRMDAYEDDPEALWNTD